MKNNLKFLVVAVSAFAISGCSSIFSDSDVGPQGYNVIVTDGKAGVVESKPVKKHVAKKANTGVQHNKDIYAVPYSTATPHKTQGPLKAGEIVPYKPNSNDNSQISFANNPFVSNSANNEASASQSAQKAQTSQQNTQVSSVSNEATVVDAITEEEVSEIPVYASSSSFNSSCNIDSNKAINAAYNLGLAISKQLTNDQGKVYAAPTVISDEYLDCGTDVSNSVAQALGASGRFSVVSQKMIAGQNRGSSAVIPALIRSCKAQNIPYLNMSVISKVKGKACLTVRIIRVSDGITLAQKAQYL